MSEHHIRIAAHDSKATRSDHELLATDGLVYWMGRRMEIATVTG
jgi:hypothetical protein